MYSIPLECPKPPFPISDNILQLVPILALSRVSVFLQPPRSAILVRCSIRAAITACTSHDTCPTIEGSLYGIRKIQVTDDLLVWTMRNPLPHAFRAWSVLLAFDVTLALPCSDVFCDDLTIRA